METIQEFFPGYYRDSVALMKLSSQLARQDGIVSASAQMATAANIGLMVDSGLLATALAPRPNDLVIVIRSATAAQAQAALDFAEAALDEKKSGSAGAPGEPERSLAMAMAHEGGNFALISTPGEFAGAEALKALKLGLNVMMFSDNVPVGQEVMLKQYAAAHDLLVMGPDCGTAIVSGVPLAFANVIAPGGIGVIGASGTGIQQVTCLIDRWGAGISHALGTGGHDLSQEVGGLSMLSALKLLERDPATRVVVLISKPPAEAVARKVLAAAAAGGKPVVVCFLGSGPREPEGNLRFARTLEEAAVLAVALGGGREAEPVRRSPLETARLAALKARLSRGDLRALYTGGTFCYEAQVLLRDSLPGLSSNTPTQGVAPLADLWTSRGHTVLDLGDDEFTRGKPHPMIDPSLRNQRLVKEAADPRTSVILLDVVLGYGSHENPAAELVPVLAEAGQRRPDLVVVGFVCGTDKDPQGRRDQEARLAAAGMVLAESNAHAVEIVKTLLAP